MIRVKIFILFFSYRRSKRGSTKDRVNGNRKFRKHGRNKLRRAKNREAKMHKFEQFWEFQSTFKHSRKLEFVKKAKKFAFDFSSSEKKIELRAIHEEDPDRLPS